MALLVASAPASARDLRVCADPNNLPFSNEDRQGFENKIAELIAGELGATVTYTWWAQRRGFLRNTLEAGLCDVVAGVPAGLDMVTTTPPYYRSSFAFVSRQGGPDVASFDDPALRGLRIGVPIVGADAGDPPPVQALSRRGISGVRGYPVYGDYGGPFPAERIVKAVAEGEIDVAIAWGPLAGYFASRQPVPLRVAPVRPLIDGARLPMAFDIAFAVRRGNEALRDELTAALGSRRAEIDAILADYGVPRLDRPAGRASP